MSTQQIKKVRAPKGFMFKIVESFDTDSCSSCPCSDCISNKKTKKTGKTLQEVSIQLYRKGSDKKIGFITLLRFNSKSFETHSYLNPQYHGKGYGARMYARAIQWCLENGYKARSSGISSELATRVWRGKTLRRYFNVRFNKSRSTFFAWNKSQ